MFKPISTAFVVLGFGLTAACGDAIQPRQPTTDVIEQPEGFPFAVKAKSLSDMCSDATSQSCAIAVYPPPGATLVDLSQPEPGRLCLKGNVGNGGWGGLALSYSVYGADGIEQIFDADALGITEVRVKLEGPPPTGVTLNGATVTNTYCPGGLNQECRTGGFFLTDPQANTVLEFKKSAEVDGPFADFIQQDAGGPKDFDTSKLDAFRFSVNSAGPVSFCLSDFEFLDEDGNVVTP